jgi:hypothetical protein
MLPAPAALEANPVSPYADARSRDVSGISPAPGGEEVQVDEEFSSILQYMMMVTTVRIMRRNHVAMAAATRPFAVAYAYARFWYSAMDRVSVWHPLLSCMWKGGSQHEAKECENVPKIQKINSLRLSGRARSFRGPGCSTESVRRAALSTWARRGGMEAVSGAVVSQGCTIRQFCRKCTV